MPLHSMSSLQPNPSGPNGSLRIFFRVFVRVVPDLAYGRRLEMIRGLEKMQHLVELALEDISYINVEGPVMFTHQIGQAPARLTFSGWYTTAGANDQPVEPISQPDIIHSGTISSEKTAVYSEWPRGGDLGQGQDPTAATDSRVALLKNDIEAALDAIAGVDRVFFIDFNGVKYGHIPNRNGFRSFPS